MKAILIVSCDFKVDNRQNRALFRACRKYFGVGCCNHRPCPRPYGRASL